MIQCHACEFFSRGASGEMGFRCDPFLNIKEPECLTKWQILKTAELTQKVQRMVGAYEAAINIYNGIIPLQEKMFRHMQRELDDIEESDSWKGAEQDRPPIDNEGDGDKREDGSQPWSG